jgi:putative endonuclease
MPFATAIFLTLRGSGWHSLSHGRGAMPMWYVYFLQLGNGDIYVGSTDDLKQRFSSHQEGHVLSTKAYLPVVLRSYVAVETEEHTRDLDVYFKSGSGKVVALKRLIRRN